MRHAHRPPGSCPGAQALIAACMPEIQSRTNILGPGSLAECGLLHAREQPTCQDQPHLQSLACCKQGKELDNMVCPVNTSWSRPDQGIAGAPHMQPNAERVNLFCTELLSFCTRRDGDMPWTHLLRARSILCGPTRPSLEAPALAACTGIIPQCNHRMPLGE